MYSSVIIDIYTCVTTALSNSRTFSSEIISYLFQGILCSFPTSKQDNCYSDLFYLRLVLPALELLYKLNHR